MLRCEGVCVILILLLASSSTLFEEATQLLKDLQRSFGVRKPVRASNLLVEVLVQSKEVSLKHGHCDLFRLPLFQSENSLHSKMFN